MHNVLDFKKKRSPKRGRSRTTQTDIGKKTKNHHSVPYLHPATLHPYPLEFELNIPITSHLSPIQIQTPIQLLFIFIFPNLLPYLQAVTLHLYPPKFENFRKKLLFIELK